MTLKKLPMITSLKKWAGLTLSRKRCVLRFSTALHHCGAGRERCVAVYSRTVATEEQRVRSMLSTDFTHYDLVWFGEATSQKEALELAEG